MSIVLDGWLPCIERAPRQLRRIPRAITRVICAALDRFAR